jgi:hypothetical protein
MNLMLRSNKGPGLLKNPIFIIHIITFGYNSSIVKIKPFLRVDYARTTIISASIISLF